MSDDGLLIRCPGCGNLKRVAMVVGQQLRCDVCRTVFLAPVVSSQATATTGADVEIVPRADVRRAGEPGGTFGLSDAVASHAEAELNGSLLATRVWCSDDWKLPPQTPTALPSLGPIPSLEEVSDGSDAVASPPDRLRREGEIAGDRESVASADHTTAASIEAPGGKERRWGLFWTAMATCGGIVALTLGVAACIAMWSDWGGIDRRGTERTPMTARKSPPRGEPPSTAAPWTDASRFSQRLSHAEVKVLRTFYGPVRVRDLNNQVVLTRDENLLAVTVSVRNLGPRPCPFFNWYVNVFEGQSGDPVVAELSDDHARQYALLRFDDASSVEGQRWTAQIEPRGRVQDTVVFLVPEEVARGEIGFFHLSLPAAGVGLAGSFRFRIPVHMIEGF